MISMLGVKNNTFMLMKGNIKIVLALRANIHVLVFTYTYNNLFFERFIHFVYIPLIL